MAKQFPNAEGIIALVASRNACRCGTGHYCHRHRRYGLRPGKVPLVHYSVLTEHNIGVQQPCGGGRRVVRKNIGSA